MLPASLSTELENVLKGVMESDPSPAVVVKKASGTVIYSFIISCNDCGVSGSTDTVLSSTAAAEEHGDAASTALSSITV